MACVGERMSMRGSIKAFGLFSSVLLTLSTAAYRSSRKLKNFADWLWTQHDILAIKHMQNQR
jgi:hypothetical protein